MQRFTYDVVLDREEGTRERFIKISKRDENGVKTELQFSV